MSFLMVLPVEKPKRIQTANLKQRKRRTLSLNKTNHHLQTEKFTIDNDVPLMSKINIFDYVQDVRRNQIKYGSKTIECRSLNLNQTLTKQGYTNINEEKTNVVRHQIKKNRISFGENGKNLVKKRKNMQKYGHQNILELNIAPKQFTLKPIIKSAREPTRKSLLVVPNRVKETTSNRKNSMLTPW